MNANAIEKCKIIEIGNSETDIDVAALIPDSVFSDNLTTLYEEIEENLPDTVGMDDMPLGIFNELVQHCLDKGKIRDAMLLTLHANMGVRNSDVSTIKVYEILKPDRTFHKRITFGEQKTGKLRNFYINKAMQIAIATYLRSNPDKKMLDYLITSEGRRKKYETTSVKLKDGNSMQYETVAPLSRMQEERIIKDNLIEIGVNLKNDQRCAEGEYKLNTHSLRKLYAEQFAETAYRLKKEGVLNVDTQIIKYVQLDLNHSDTNTTMRYFHKFERDKEVIVNAMNIGLDVWVRYINK